MGESERQKAGDYGRAAGRHYEQGYREWVRQRGRPGEDEPRSTGESGTFGEEGGGGWSSGRRSGPPVEGGYGYTGGGYGARYGTDEGYGGGDYEGGGRPTDEEFGHSGGGLIERVKRFFGKGPKGYKRSDERIREDVCDRLSEGYLDASDLEVEVQDGEVTLKGQVSHKHFKRIAEDLADEVIGVQEVHNQLRVRRETPSERETASEPGEPPREGNGRREQSKPRSQ